MNDVHLGLMCTLSLQPQVQRSGVYRVLTFVTVALTVCCLSLLIAVSVYDVLYAGLKSATPKCDKNAGYR